MCTIRLHSTIAVLACLVALGFYDAVNSQASANEVISHDLIGVQSTQAVDREGAESRLPMLTDRSQLPPRVLEAIEAGLGGVVSQGYGTAMHPFTTKRAGARGNTIVPMNKFPWRVTGKLWMRFGADLFVCTASVIKKGVIVTAAHCVHNFGDGNAGFADEVIFEPARHRGNATCTPATCPFGEWVAIQIWIPTVYWDGTDVCTTFGVVCENDVAVVVLDTLNGKFIQQVVGKYGFKFNNWGYTNFLGEKAAQIAQMGYPLAHDSGYRMIRTDSLGYQDVPNNVIIGSDQTGGSSGGPWIMNFGINSSSTSSKPTHNTANQVVATTSWGFTDSTIKVQGASRFAKNTTFTIKSNIQTLVDLACAANPSHC